MQVRPVGRHALLVECATAQDVVATYATVRGCAAELGALDIVPAARTVLIDGVPDQAAATALLAAVPAPVATSAEESPTPLVELPTRYDGPDLAEVARQWQCTTDEVIRIHQTTLFTVAFCGFSPGFGYCTGLGPDHVVSRRPDPRPTVPAGSVALAGEYTGVYPTSSPGGWQVIGTTTATLWVPEAPQPAVLAPGTRVRFVDAGS